MAPMTEKTTIACDAQPAISPRSEPEQAAQTPDALAKALASNPRFVVLPPSGKGYIIGRESEVRSARAQTSVQFWLTAPKKFWMSASSIQFTLDQAACDRRSGAWILFPSDSRWRSACGPSSQGSRAIPSVSTSMGTKVEH
jgi:hypothetical protein